MSCNTQPYPTIPHYTIPNPAMSYHTMPHHAKLNDHNVKPDIPVLIKNGDHSQGLHRHCSKYFWTAV